MAEQIARSIILKRRLDWTVTSAGLYASPGQPMSKHSALALEQMGVSVSPHESKIVTEELIRNADLVLAMTSGHAWDLRAAFPQYFEKIHELGVYATTDSNPLSATCDIVDPFGGSLEQYTLCAQMLCEYVEKAIDKVQRYVG